jgi:hypothetical protein
MRRPACGEVKDSKVINPILHTAWLDNQEILQNIILVKKSNFLHTFLKIVSSRSKYEPLLVFNLKMSVR